MQAASAAPENDKNFTNFSAPKSEREDLGAEFIYRIKLDFAKMHKFKFVLQNLIK